MSIEDGKSLINQDILERKRRKKVLQSSARFGFSAEEGNLIYDAIYKEGQEQGDALDAIFAPFLAVGPITQAESDQFDEIFAEEFLKGGTGDGTTKIVPLRPSNPTPHS